MPNNMGENKNGVEKTLFTVSVPVTGFDGDKKYVDTFPVNGEVSLLVVKVGKDAVDVLESEEVRELGGLIPAELRNGMRFEMENQGVCVFTMPSALAHLYRLV